MTWIQMGEVVSLVMMAFAVGLDGFSVSLGLGMQPIRLKRIAFIGLIMGVFHFILPFIGMMIGHFISERIQYFTSLSGGFILIFIGSYMVFSAFQQKQHKLLNPYSLQVFSLAFIVSLDSFSIGLSLGLSGVKTMLLMILFGVTAMVFSWTGMIIGRRVHKFLGVYSEVLGGSILFLFGLYMIFLRS